MSVPETSTGLGPQLDPSQPSPPGTACPGPIGEVHLLGTCLPVTLCPQGLMSCDHTQTHIQSQQILERSLTVRWLGPSVQSWIISLHYTSLFQGFFFLKCGPFIKSLLNFLFYNTSF